MTIVLAALLNGRVMVLLLAAALVACEQPATQQELPPVAVGVLDVQPRKLPLVLEYAAQLRGVREVEVRARVSGILLERHYVEGSRVEAGELLFTIDPEQFRAEVARARAEVGVQQVGLEQARRERERVLKLFDQDLASRRERDAAVAAYESAAAAVASAEAALRRSELDLSYTEVRAPIGGLTSREVRSEGSLINAGDDSGLLAYIVQSDRLYVQFAVSEADATLLHEALARTNGVTPVVRVMDTRGERIGKEAAIEFIAPRVDDATGTVEVRAVLDNRDGSSLPGRIVRARVEGIGIFDALIIPKRAVMHGAEGPFVWLIDGGEQVAPSPVVLGTASGNNVSVVSGLARGDRVVVDGILKVQPGAAVSASSVSLDGVGEAPAPGGTGP